MSFLQRYPWSSPKSTGASLQGVTYVVNSDTINCLQVCSCGFPSTLKHIRKNLSVSRGEEREERGWCQGKVRCLQPAWKADVFSSDPSGLIWFKKVNGNSLEWQKSLSISYNYMSPDLALYRRVEWKSEYVICFVLYPQATHDFPLSFCCKTWVPWTVPPENKNLLELEKAFPHEHFKRNQSNYSGLFPPASSVCHRWQTLPSLGQAQISHKVLQHHPGAPGLLPPSGSWAQRDVTTPGNPQDLESQAWKQLTGIKLSGPQWVWSDHFPWKQHWD